MNRVIRVVRTGRETLTDIRTQNYGFLRLSQLATLAADPETRLTSVMVRCGACRFTCPAQDARHLIDIITRDGQDYVRDVSLPAADDDTRALAAFAEWVASGSYTANRERVADLTDRARVLHRRSNGE